MVDICINLSMIGTEIIPVIHTVQGDTGRSIVATIVDMDIPSGSTASFWALKPSGKGIYNDATISGNTVTAALTNQTLAESGTIHGQFQITSSSKMVKTFCFDILNDASLAGDYPESENEATWLDTKISDMEKDLSSAISSANSKVSTMQTNVNTAISNATTATNSAKTAARSANNAANNARDALTALEDAVAGTIINDEEESTITTYSSSHIEEVVANAVDGFLTPTGNGSRLTVGFTKATSRTAITTGETIMTLFGKVAKWLGDLGTAAFKSVANDLTTTTAYTSVLDAYQGKLLNDKIATLNTTVTNNTTEYTKTLTMTFASGSQATKSIELHRIGNLVQCSIRVVGSVSSASGAMTGLATIPDGYKPVHGVRQFYVASAANTMSDSIWGYWNIGTDGTVSGVTNNTAYKERYCDCCWLTTDDYPSS